MILPDKAIQIIETWRLGFVATVAPNGTPNVSPKGTFVVLNQKSVAFGEMNSPNTVRNIRNQKQVEVNFVDILSRRGLRLRGDARIIDTQNEWYPKLIPNFEGLWDQELIAKFRAIVLIEVSTFRQLITPAYDLGASETDFRKMWKDKIAAMPDEVQQA